MPREFLAKNNISLYILAHKGMTRIFQHYVCVYNYSIGLGHK